MITSAIFFPCAFIIIEKPEIIIGCVTGNWIYKIPRLVSRNQVGIVPGYIFIIEGRIAEKQKVLQLFSARFLIKMSHKIPDGGRILVSRRKFIVNFPNGNHLNLKLIVGRTKRGQPESLTTKCLCSYNNHIRNR